MRRKEIISIKTTAKKQVAEKKRATPSDITGLVLFFLSLDYAAVLMLMVHA